MCLPISDVVRLTAQFVARNGRQFLATLARMEGKNHQFDFLRQNHSLFGYFTKLVEHYTKVLVPSKATKERLRENVANRTAVRGWCASLLFINFVVDFGPCYAACRVVAAEGEGEGTVGD